MTHGNEKLVAEILLWICLAVSASVWAIHLAAGDQVSAGSFLAARLAFPIILSSWVTADARARGRNLFYDLDTFIFFAWPIVLPCYLFQTRGLRAFVSLVCFAAICLAAALFGCMVYVVLLLLLR